MMYSKKYYTIKEASEMLGVSQGVLRYAEKRLSKLKIRTINSRRYYTDNNISILRDAVGNATDYSAILLKIDFLEKQSMKIMNIMAPVLGRDISTMS